MKRRMRMIHHGGTESTEKNWERMKEPRMRMRGFVQCERSAMCTLTGRRT